MKIKLSDNAIMPTRAHDTDAGLDLYATEDKVVPAGGSAVFDIGIHVELPRFHTYRSESQSYGIRTMRNDYNTVGLITSKSGLYFKHGIISTGTVDFSYRGSIKVKLSNLGSEDYEVKRGDKISQLVILPILTPSLEVVSELEETERGDGGFGSSGR